MVEAPTTPVATVHSLAEAVADVIRPGDCGRAQPFVIGIAGGTASGKTTVCERIVQSLGGEHVVVLSLDEFYRDLTPSECLHISDVNFDEPSAFDVATLVACLDVLRQGEHVDVPVYDFTTSCRSRTTTRRVNAADVVIVEGILVLHIPELLQRCNMKIFVETDDDVRLARRIKRDTVERGRNVEGVLMQYTRFVKPSFQRYVLPSRLNADVIVPWRESNAVATDLITQHIRAKLMQHDLRRIYSNLHVMPATMQTRGMHTIIRSRTTGRHDFVFYADRLCRMIVETALGQLPFTDCNVTTPTGQVYSGVSFSRKLCGVSIIRSGEAMENALRACCKGIKIGKVLIHRSGDSCGDLVYERLPQDIADRSILLMDPILATGNTVTKVIDLLVRHRSVEESKIVLLTLIAAPEGIRKVCERYPKVKVITSEIDESTGPDNNVRPGVGDFGDRYFGTTNMSDERLMVLTPQANRAKGLHDSSETEGSAGESGEVPSSDS